MINKVKLSKWDKFKRSLKQIFKIKDNDHNDIDPIDWNTVNDNRPPGPSKIVTIKLNPSVYQWAKERTKEIKNNNELS